eukprot:7210214-Prymnesium_polylepis.1
MRFLLLCVLLPIAAARVPCPLTRLCGVRVPVTLTSRLNLIRMTQDGQEALRMALLRAKTPRAGRAELIELERVISTAPKGSGGDLMREARELVAELSTEIAEKSQVVPPPWLQLSE